MHSTTATFDLLLRDSEGLDEKLLTPERPTEWPARLLGVATAGLLAHGAVVGLAGHRFGHLHGLDWLWMPLALVGSFLGALAICLPALHLYTRFAGLDVEPIFVASQALRAQARTSAMLLGLLPLYACAALAAELGGMTESCGSAT